MVKLPNVTNYFTACIGKQSLADELDNRGWNKAFLFDRPFLVLTQIILQFTFAAKGYNNSSVTQLFCPAFTGRSTWFAENWPFHTYLIQQFSQKNTLMLSSCSQHPLNPKQNNTDIFAKPAFHEITQCYCTQTHYKM